jgi:hypothetical protein
MTRDEIKAAISGWCDQQTAIQLVEDRSEAGADFVLGLRSGTLGAATVPVEVLLETDSDRVTIRSSSTTTASPEEIKGLLASRPAAVRGDGAAGGTSVTAYAYLDGFSKNVFVNVVEEVVKTRTLLDGLSTTAAGTVVESESAAAQPEPWAETSPVAEPAQATPASALPAPSFGSPSGGVGYSPLSGQPAQQPQPAAAAFGPTHTVPPQGMQAWAAPDPNGAVVATLGGGLPIQVTEVRGAWARVLCSNGWTGWVDGRIIGVAH